MMKQRCVCVCVCVCVCEVILSGSVTMSCTGGDQGTSEGRHKKEGCQ